MEKNGNEILLHLRFWQKESIFRPCLFKKRRRHSQALLNAVKSGAVRI